MERVVYYVDMSHPPCMPTLITTHEQLMDKVVMEAGMEVMQGLSTMDCHSSRLI
jgi:hypothetical protein